MSNDMQSQICCRGRKLISLFRSTPPRFSRADCESQTRWTRSLVNYDRYTYTRATLEERELKLMVPLWPLDDTSMLPLIRPFISRHGCSSRCTADD